LFVNGRAVNDTVVKHAVRQAYESLYGAGGHPAYVLFLQIEPTDVDVNVHPTKQEVRFCEPRMVHDFVRSAVLRCLQGQAQGPGESLPDVPRETQPIAERAGPAAITAVGHDRGGAALASHPGARTATASESGRRQTQWTGSRPARGDQRQPSGWPRLAAGIADQDVEVDGVVANRFRVRVRADGVYVTDLLGPRQRRIEQRLQALMDSSDSEPLAARPLLLPRRLPLEVAASQAMRVVMPRLERLGIRLRIDGAGHCLLLSLPVAYAGMPVDAVAGALEQLASALVAVDGGQTGTITAATRRFVLRLSHLAAPDTAEAGPEVEDRACGQPDEDAVRIDARTLLRLLCESVDGPDEVSRAQPFRADSDVDG
ncbi:MAG: hypothetical protein KDK91_22535, partial [Gammaproteobacteria bacterium]|nr:hypothetical protein [Gammaproteobacteria bacterium]